MRYYFLFLSAFLILGLSASISGTQQYPSFNFSHKHFIHSRQSPDPGKCQPSDPIETVTDRLQNLLNTSGPGYRLSLCPQKTYLLTAPLVFTAPNQEISTLGYPTDDTRATLVVNGPIFNGGGHTIAINGTCTNCDYVRVRNIQVNGTRGNYTILNGGGNLEMGGPNKGQLVEYVKSWDPRGWSCLHICEGDLVNCSNTTVRYNDIGPCGSDRGDLQWADGISLACTNSRVHGNMINSSTDGGITIFGSPGSTVENNTIWVEDRTMRAGLSLSNYNPYHGDYRGTTVRNNTIRGGFATGAPANSSVTRGVNKKDAMIKIGISAGTRIWYGNAYGNNATMGAMVSSNRLTGGFSYGMAVSGVGNFTLVDNALFGNTAFFGNRGPTCSPIAPIPDPSAYIYQFNTTLQSTLQFEFQTVPYADDLTCILPPNGGNYWPYGDNAPIAPPSGSHGVLSTTSAKIALAFGLVIGIIVLCLLAWFIRRWIQNRESTSRVYRLDTYTPPPTKTTYRYGYSNY
ncbi:hypothetical protein BOTBODRAFT_571308 [Botryobasidium botryosum FD-172 SS1]|uniref:Uncharacterized protein n=1 Tax=Botryobasidium botryosum (strain FD-172 SS1) TaxID=930990 RepID=A0A067M9K7_BOTB1|nr:hypothetical protein BOTBODRAFT_571308 [Botryobasidium botryosum FD-172 SS1]